MRVLPGAAGTTDEGAGRGFHRVARATLRVLHALRWRCRATGLEHVPPTGGAVITWNHHGHLDMIPVAAAIYQHRGRPVRFLAHADLFDRPLVGAVLRIVDALPTDGGSQLAVDALRSGQLVLVAPEGRISPSGELGSFRTGAARMAREAGVPLVPAATWGTQRVSTTGHRDPRAAWRLTAEVAFGPALLVRPDDDPAAVTEALRGVTGELLREVRSRHGGV